MDMSKTLTTIELNDLQTLLKHYPPAQTVLVPLPNTTVNSYLYQKSPHYSTDALRTMAQ
jgi:hypothetical protein